MDRGRSLHVGVREQEGQNFEYREVDMARQEIGRLGEAMARDPELRAKLQQAKDVDAVIATARAAGYAFTAEELSEEARTHKQELTEEQLERVAGGFHFSSPSVNVLLLRGITIKQATGL
jgi:predicted ribosomally synthesized peptide with nif11-like leader